MNTIALRIADFLKNHPPFSMLQTEQLFAIAQAVEVHYVEKDQIVFETDTLVKDQFYMVKDGAIGLYRNNKSNLVDECDEGDIFGLRALMRQGNYQLSAIALEESIIYSISANLLSEYITVNSEASTFLLKTFVSNSNFNTTDSFIDPSTNKTKTIPDFNEELSATYSKNPIHCSLETSIQEAAKTMTSNRVGSIIITQDKKPVGIITDKDLRVKIATGTVAITQPVTEIMSAPVITYPEYISVAEAQIAMLQHKITHLCITEDGTNQTELKGVLSEHDIIVVRENNASVLVKEIKRAKTTEELKHIIEKTQQLLKRYVSQKLPIIYITRIISAINNSITNKIIEFALKSMSSPPPVSFAWLAIGSQGRQEQLLLTDQDNCLVFEDVKPEIYQQTQEYFLLLAEQVTKHLNTVGFEFCPADMMASNPKWCLSVSQWQAQFKRWITQPDQDNLMLCTIFFDYERVYGNSDLVDQLSESIFKSIDSYEIFLNYLGLNALKNPPPLSFFRNFLVEDSGEHKDQFDIKARAIMPLVDAARLLILSKEIKSFNSTIERYTKLAELEPQNRDLYNACIEAFKNLLYFRTQQGLLHADSGRYINLQTLSKADKLELKSAFQAVKAVQELLQVRFKLSQLM
jgi:CBS domain-containing protein